jgi:hypothetical protein
VEHPVEQRAPAQAEPALVDAAHPYRGPAGDHDPGDNAVPGRGGRGQNQRRRRRTGSS